MTERIKLVLVIISTASVIFVNHLAAIGSINNIATKAISDKYTFFLAPADYVFSVWALIFIGISAFSIYQVFPSTFENLSKTRTFYIISCLANIGWVYSWHHEYIFLSLILMLILLASLVLISIHQIKKTSPTNFWFVKIPFSIYFGWISYAAILNISILFISFGFKTSYFVSNLIACILIAAIAGAGVVIREKISTFAYPLILAWALTAVAAKQSGKTAIVFLCAFGVIALLISTLSFFVKDHSKLK